jgi:hypothetical protein
MGWVESVLGGSAETAGDGSGPGGVSNFYGEMSALESLPSQLGDRRYAELISIGAAMTDDEAMSYVDDQIGPDRGPEAFTSSVHELESVNEFRPEGDVWLLGYDGEACRLKDSKGMQYLAVLLAQPGREIHVAHLAGASIAESAGTGPALDARAAAEYRNRLSELQSELDEAEDFADPERIARARAEMDALTAELTSAYGLGGRARTGPDPAERVRKAVTNRIRDALDRIEKEHPSMGRHLRNAVRTGTFCSYNPERPTTWTL